jgi:hypothetical protein
VPCAYDADILIITLLAGYINTKRPEVPTEVITETAVLQKVTIGSAKPAAYFWVEE